ncbi:probable S-adenosylmethionine-dependent methyltransferase At5g38780 [Durio zibethinus]|uniref:Probable S-adenosylmethionine-dependent methyltransferase At5g38780 n=1 Tax=Durio zibethinus TaxID=66656 RepID=A0A6P6AZ02_DURZI|nr:probable S-adenosylmethionine-dependent methyltransferase At5g38780 [Durio zibethinus]
MATDETEVLPESYPMNGGDGKVSYARNSFAQRTSVDASKKFISEAIADLLDTELNPILDSSIRFQIADLGCATGPNTFYAVQNIIEAINSKYSMNKHQKSQALEYQVFFNDHTNNDFNTLFRSLPLPRPYFPVAVPGSFYGRLFPKDSIHLMHSSNSLNWLSRVPKDVGDINSPAWNGDSIYCTGTAKEVVEAYSNQYKKDMNNFLNARALELVAGGLLVLVVGGVPNCVSLNQTGIGKDYEIIGSCLVDMANKGLISKEKVKSFNLPLYYPSPNEIEKLIEDNGCFGIERMETFPGKGKHIHNSQMWPMIVRAAFEAIISNHFGNEMVEELFGYYSKNHMDKVSIFNGDDVISLLHLNIVLKRKN